MVGISYFNHRKRKVSKISAGGRLRKNNQALSYLRKLGLGLKKQKGTGVLDKPLEAVNFAETLTKKLIPSTKPVFDRYWSGDVAKKAFTGPTGATS